ncbi:MAG: hypothetical protein WDO70_02025 [Alphaproteobacteria bacterium]
MKSALMGVVRIFIFDLLFLGIVFAVIVFLPKFFPEKLSNNTMLGFTWMFWIFVPLPLFIFLFGAFISPRIFFEITNERISALSAPFRLGFLGKQTNWQKPIADYQGIQIVSCADFGLAQSQQRFSVGFFHADEPYTIYLPCTTDRDEVEALAKGLSKSMGLPLLPDAEVDGRGRKVTKGNE